jgi:putative RNA 2'-phosphotransferase
MSKSLTTTSKFLSLVLRHKPEEIGLQMNEEGWANVNELLEKAVHHGMTISPALLDEVVNTNDKKRFAFNADKSQIRANQGHSVDINLNLEAIKPPPVLYHGTATRFLESIKEKGLLAGDRQHVHLSANQEVAVSVGARHGQPIVITVNAEQMAKDGLLFYVSDNGVWLTEKVPVGYLMLSSEQK